MPVYVPREGGVRAVHELDQVDWANLRHAYGRGRGKDRHGVNAFTREAIVIRGCPQPNESLAALASDDPDERAEAEEVLWSVLWHQGDIYEATAPAVPFVTAFLADGTHPSRSALLQWLLLIVGSCSLRRMNDGTPPRYAALQAPTWEALRASRGWLVAAATVGTEREQRILAWMLELLDGPELPPHSAGDQAEAFLNEGT
jgi:hypothetical protein